MEGFVARITTVNNAVNSFAWGPLMLLLLVGTGVFLTVKVRWLQVTHFGRILKNTERISHQCLKKLTCQQDHDRCRKQILSTKPEPDKWLDQYSQGRCGA